MAEKVNVICLKWGTLYPAEYVNRLYRGVSAHLHRPFRFVCVTDDSSGLADGVEAVAFPACPPRMEFNDQYTGWPNIYVKLCLYEPGLAGLQGPTLFLDIDQLVLGDLDCFFDYKPGEFCIIHNWVERRKYLFRKPPFCGNSSCFRFEAGGKFDYVYEKFLSELPTALDYRVFCTEQNYMTHAVGPENINFWPDNFVRSFKRSCTWAWPLNHFLAPHLPPADTRILCFHGNPSPEQAIAGYHHGKPERWTRPAKWLEQLWK